MHLYHQILSSSLSPHHCQHPTSCQEHLPPLQQAFLLLLQSLSPQPLLWSLQPFLLQALFLWKLPGAYSCLPSFFSVSLSGSFFFLRPQEHLLLELSWLLTLHQRELWLLFELESSTSLLPSVVLFSIFLFLSL